MQNYRKSPQTLTPSFILLLLATSVTLLAADLTTRPDPVGRTLDKQIGVQASAEANLGRDGASVALGVQTSSDGRGNQRDNERRAEAAVNASHDSEGQIHAQALAQAQLGTNPDGGMAPVPEPSTWVGLGSLLVMGLVLLRLENRKKSLP